MRSYESLMRQAMSIMKFAHIDDAAVKDIAMQENSVTIRGEKHYYRTATITLHNGNRIIIRDDASFECDDEHYNTIDSADLLK